MKKTFLILLFVLTLLLSASCTSENENEPDQGGDDPATITQVEFSLVTQDGNTEIIRPGDRLIPLVTVLYDDGTQQTAEELSLTVTDGSDSIITIDEQSFLVDQEALSGVRIQCKVDYLDYSKSWEVLIKKDPNDYIDEQGIVTDYSQTDALINKERALPADYAPSDLVKLQVPTVLANAEINQLRQPASEALSALFEEALTQGFTLRARSGYRSYSTQNSLFQSSVARNGLEHANKYSARPGHSEHQTGLAMDITASSVNNQLSESFGTTQEGIWVAENAHRFGFIIRYPKGKEEITGYNYEPWHLRYVGLELATEIYNSGLTMEEYFQ